VHRGVIIMHIVKHNLWLVRFAILIATSTVAFGARKPNIVILLADDLGYADVGVYGASGFTTPHIDRMAREGVKMTRFYMPAPVCSASRAALLTGCYPVRVGIDFVIGAEAKIGLADDEVTMAEMLKTSGYRTAIFGKWHLGNQAQFLPSRHGFDVFYGTRGSNDMGRGHPSLEMRRKGLAGVELIDGDEVVEINPDQKELTRRYTQRAVAFIEESAKQEEPFFLYLPYNMPHTPLFASKEYSGKTERGPYGDAVSEIDWSVGRVLAALETSGVGENTLVIFTSDNGPWLIFGDHAGSAGPLSGGKKQMLEGGVRVPCVMWWPGEIEGGRVVDGLATCMDIWPTIAELVGAELPEHAVDGVNIWKMVSEKERAETSPRELFFYYWRKELHAVSDGRWKLRFAHIDKEVPNPEEIGYGGIRGTVMRVERSEALFDLMSDEGETKDVREKYPENVSRLKAAAEEARIELGDSLRNVTGTGMRKPGLAN
jgi:arylsulfatase A